MSSQAVIDPSGRITTFVQRVPGVTHAVLVSSDGLPISISAGLDRDTADQLAAVTSGLVSVAVAASSTLRGDGVRQAVVEMGRGYLIAMPVADGSVFAALATYDADLGEVGYQLTSFVRQLGIARLAAPAPRASSWFS